MRTTFRRGFARPFDELREELDRLWAPLTAAPPLHGWGVTTGGVFPAVNVAEDADAVIVEAELPGLDAERIDVSVANDELVITGSRHDAEAEAGEAAKQIWHRRERGTGQFERRVALPAAVDPEQVEARLTDGVLRVTCPKAAEAKPRRIAVRAG